MKFPTTIISLSALFLASLVVAAPDDPNKIDTCTQPGVVALTFDDGPGIYNDKLLEILKRKNVKATFFMIGEMIVQTPAQSASLKKIMADGHQLASHTYTHRSLDSLTEAEMKKEIQDTSDAMFTHAGVRPAYMRAPEGRCAALCTKVMTELGLVISHWNVDTNDWRHKAQPAQTAADLSMVEINDVIIKNSNPAVDSFILLQHEIHKFS
ncbi:chitin deacetylase, partial [Podila epigama]